VPANASTLSGCGYILDNTTGMVLGSYPENQGPGIYVYETYLGDEDYQNWCLQANSNGTYYIILEGSSPTLCLDSHTDNSGQLIWTWTCNGSAPQQWKWNGNGYLVRATDPQMSLHGNGWHNTVTIQSGNNPTFLWST
jgi:YD repeat-containing protein